MTQTITPELPCPLWRRLLALIYDLMAVLAIVMVVGLICQLATHGRLVDGGATAHIAWWYQPLQGLVVAAYFLISWVGRGQTLGMRPWRIRIAASHSARLGPRQALLRLMIAALPLLLLWLAPVLGLQTALWLMFGAWMAWFAPALVDSRCRALHDLIAGSQLCKIV